MTPPTAKGGSESSSGANRRSGLADTTRGVSIYVLFRVPDMGRLTTTNGGAFQVKDGAVLCPHGGSWAGASKEENLWLLTRLNPGPD
jgi:hypothetical protein